MFVKKITSIVDNVKDPIVKILDKLNSQYKGVINITLEKFNKLLAGEAVDGYAAYKETSLYKIVDSDPKIKIELINIKNNKFTLKEIIDATIINNVNGSIPHNEETNASFKSMETPTLAIREFTTVIKPGEDMRIWYFVDTKLGDRTNKNKISDTFTTTIRDSQDNILAKYTTYAGEFQTTVNFGNLTGETWFSIQTVDNHGVASAMQFFDVLIKDTTPKNIYKMVEYDLERFELTPDNDDPIVGYKNKMGLSQLFKWASQNGYDGIKLYNPANYIYYIDYHKNISKTPGEIDLGTTYYHLYHVENGQLVGDRIDLTPNKEFTINGKNYTVGDDVCDWITHDGAELYRNPDGKVRTRWRDTWLDPNTQVWSTENYLRTYRLSAFTEIKTEKVDGVTVSYPAYSKFADGYYYVITYTVPYITYQGAAGGDFIEFPDNFTIDLNKCTIQAIPCYNIRVDGNILRLYENINTHVKNGKIVGMYRNYNFPRNFIMSGLSYGSTPVEHVKCTSMNGCKYCSFEDLDISYSTGYDGTIDALNTGASGSYDSTSNTDKYDPNNPYTCTYPRIRFNKPGYINYEGKEVVVQPIAPLKENSSDLVYGDSIGLTYTSMFIPCNPKYTNKNGEVVYTHEISIEPGGYKQYMAGKQHDVFVHFYDKNYRFIKTVKTHMYMLVKTPQNTQYVKLTGYGVFKNGQPALDSKGRNVAFQHITLTARGVFSKNTLFKNCFWHDTRTIAIHMAYAKGHTWDGCKYTRIAIEPRTDWFVTKIFGDFEEGWESIDHPIMKNCWAERGFSNETNDWGQRVIAINCCRNFLFIDNEGVGVEERGGIESALYYRSTIPILRVNKNGKYERPVTKYYDLSVPEELRFDYKNNINDVYGTYNSRYNRCDNTVFNKVKLSHITHVSPTYGTQGKTMELSFDQATLVPKK